MINNHAVIVLQANISHILLNNIVKNKKKQTAGTLSFRHFIHVQLKEMRYNMLIGEL